MISIRTLRNLKQELGEILSMPTHDNIIKIERIGVSTLDHLEEASAVPVLIAMPEAFGGSLKERITGDDIERRVLMTWLNEIASAVLHIHSCGLIHGNLKPQNLLLDADNNILLSDVALARVFVPTADMQFSIGAGAYVAPEVRRGRIGRRADIFSFGVVILELISRKNPSRDQEENLQVLEEVKEACESFCFKTLLIMVEKMMSQETSISSMRTT